MKKYFLMLIVLSFLFGMSGSASAQSLVSFDMWANDDHLLDEDDVDNNFVLFVAHNDAGGVEWSDFAWNVPGTVFHNYIPAVDLPDVDHWPVFITDDPILWWLGINAARDSGPHPVETHYFTWNVDDDRP